MYLIFSSCNREKQVNVVLLLKTRCHATLPELIAQALGGQLVDIYHSYQYICQQLKLVQMLKQNLLMIFNMSWIPFLLEILWRCKVTSMLELVEGNLSMMSGRRSEDFMGLEYVMKHVSSSLSCVLLTTSVRKNLQFYNQ